MANYFRITAYHPEQDLSVIMDSYGLFEKLWQFSSILVRNNIEIIEISNEDKFEDINIEPTNNNKISIRAIVEGQPEIISHNGLKAIKVADKKYIPDKNSRI